MQLSSSASALPAARAVRVATADGTSATTAPAAASFRKPRRLGAAIEEPDEETVAGPVNCDTVILRHFDCILPAYVVTAPAPRRAWLRRTATTRTRARRGTRSGRYT